MLNENVLLISFLIDSLRNPFVFILLVLITTLILGYYRKTHSLTFFFTISITYITTQSAKAFFQISRPDSALVEIGGYRFPSMHAALAGAFLASIWWYVYMDTRSVLLRFFVTIITMALIGIIAWSRVLLDVHQPIDVLVGVLLGILISFIIHLLSKLTILRA